MPGFFVLKNPLRNSPFCAIILLCIAKQKQKGKEHVYGESIELGSLRAENAKILYG